MIRYAVRSRQIVDLLGEIKRGSLILSPYFQRNLVWRDGHKQDFIETILRGYPFPQIFISKGSIDVATMVSTSCVVDGQQRMNSIREFIENRLAVGGRYFNDLTIAEREEFLKYEVAVIDLDLRDDDPQIIEVFKRLNRTFYALSTIEKLATEYASAEFMLVAKYLSGEIIDVEQYNDIIIQGSDPNITPEFVRWAKPERVRSFRELLLDGKIFSPYETSRMVHLMYTLNLEATYIFGFYNRNDKAKDMLDQFADSLPMRDDIVEKFERAAALFNKMRFHKGSMWLNKANSFSLFSVLARHLGHAEDLGARFLRETLVEFENRVPPDYQLAAKEGVNNKREREIRNAWILHVALDYEKPE